MMVSLRMFKVENTNKNTFFLVMSDEIVILCPNGSLYSSWVEAAQVSSGDLFSACFLYKTCQPTCGKIHRRAWQSNTPAVLKDPNSWLQCQRRECPRCLVGESPAQGDSKGNSYRGLNQYLYASDWWWLGFYQTYTQHLLSERTSSKKRQDKQYHVWITTNMMTFLDKTCISNLQSSEFFYLHQQKNRWKLAPPGRCGHWSS